MPDGIIITTASVKSIAVTIHTLSPWGGTSDPLYLGIITKYGGREFPLRYKRSGTALSDGADYDFGINADVMPDDAQIYGSESGGPNHVDAYPLYNVQRVYLRKEPRKESAERDDALGVRHIAAVISHSDGKRVDWSNRNLPDSSGPSPFWLGNEFGQVVYLNPETLS